MNVKRWRVFLFLIRPVSLTTFSSVLIRAKWSLATTLVQFFRPSTGLSRLRVCFITLQRSTTGNTLYVLNNPAVTSDSTSVPHANLHHFVCLHHRPTLRIVSADVAA
ncbi:hypothetical protein B0H14DRAFT_2765259 [Mycena olivaceomarginata]|nr:hypothetical protein B0H14DRAFT_2765259 [Mycena olivaceomarginata]